MAFMKRHPRVNPAKDVKYLLSLPFLERNGAQNEYYQNQKAGSSKTFLPILHDHLFYLSTLITLYNKYLKVDR